jgi:hypothetical protein
VKVIVGKKMNNSTKSIPIFCVMTPEVSYGGVEGISSVHYQLVATNIFTALTAYSLINSKLYSNI